MHTLAIKIPKLLCPGHQYRLVNSCWKKGKKKKRTLMETFSKFTCISFLTNITLYPTGKKERINVFNKENNMDVNGRWVHTSVYEDV